MDDDIDESVAWHKHFHSTFYLYSRPGIRQGIRLQEQRPRYKNFGFFVCFVKVMRRSCGERFKPNVVVVGGGAENFHFTR